MEKNIRKSEKKSIYNGCLNYSVFKNLDKDLRKKLVCLIESSILDATIDKTTEQNIPTYWDNKTFIEYYCSISYNIKINIDICSSINKNKTELVKNYLIDRLCNYMVSEYLKKSYVLYKKEKNTTNYLFNLSKPIFTHILSKLPVCNPVKIAYMNSRDLNPYINQEYIDDLQQRMEQKVKIKYSAMYTCSQCKNKKTQMHEIQTRSSDEGGTLFINCLVCNHTWRQYG